jgi:hypothetical protein
MPFQQRWYVNKRVLLIKMYGDLDLDEMTRNNDEMVAKMNEGTPLVHILIDDAKVGKIPASLGQLKQIFTGPHPSAGWVILIGPGSQIQNFLVGMIGKILRANIRREATLEAAIKFLRERDITIPWHEANEESFPSA